VQNERFKYRSEKMKNISDNAEHAGDSELHGEKHVNHQIKKCREDMAIVRSDY